MTRKKMTGWVEINIIFAMVAIVMVKNAEGATVAATAGGTAGGAGGTMASDGPTMAMATVMTGDKKSAMYCRIGQVMVNTTQGTDGMSDCPSSSKTITSNDTIPGNPSEFKVDWNKTTRMVMMSWKPPTDKKDKLKGYVVKINSTKDADWCFAIGIKQQQDLRTETGMVMCMLKVPWYNVKFDIKLDDITLRSLPYKMYNMGVKQSLDIEAHAPVMAEKPTCDDNKKGKVDVKWYQAAFMAEYGNFTIYMIRVTKTSKDMMEVMSKNVTYDYGKKMYTHMFNDLEDGNYLVWVKSMGYTKTKYTKMYIEKNDNFQVQCTTTVRPAPIPTGETTAMNDDSSAIPTAAVSRFIAAAPLAILTYLYL